MKNMAILGIFLLAACGGSTENPAGECWLETPASFESVDELEVGLTPRGVALGYWTVSFDQGSFEWFHSDVIEFGDYACEGASVRSVDLPSYAGVYDPEAATLVWEGVLYEQVEAE